jgi:hypothetical protein
MRMICQSQGEETMATTLKSLKSYQEGTLLQMYQ